MKIGIVWLPNIGKSTLFNALTKSYAAQAANFPFCTIEPNVGIVEVKDKRLDRLSEVSGSTKKIYAAIEFVDIAGLVKGAWKGEWLGNKFLSHIREVDAIVEVLRYFSDTDVNHVEWEVDPVRDAEIINFELIFADLQQVEKALDQAQKKSKSKDKDALAQLAVFTKVKKYLEAWTWLHTVRDDFDDAELLLLRPYNLLSIKPIVYALNVSQEDLGQADVLEKEYSDKLSAPVRVVCAKLEEDMIEFNESEREEYLQDLLARKDLDHVPTLDDLIALAYKTVGLMYYFTTGEKESRARTIPIDSKAPRAAAAIHTDFEKWFIKAEVVSYDALANHGSWNGAKEKWQVRLEGKEYVVQDGDVMVFKFNV